MSKSLTKRINYKYRKAWRAYYTSQNLLSVRAASLAFLVLNGIIRLLYLIFPLSLTRAENFPEFDLTNWAFIGSAFIFYAASHFLIADFRKKQHPTAIMSFFIFAFALYLIFCGMYSSFIATADPRNAIVLYLIALTVVGILLVFEYYETIILMAAAELLFTSLLIVSHTDPTEMVYNQLVSIILLSGFYIIQRYFFSYKASNYMQVLEIKDKNLEIERGSELKSQLLGMVAHDLRNPIAAVQSMAMIMEMDDISEETQENINLIKASCEKALDIIGDLLETARNENITELVTKKTELDKFITDIIEVWKIQKQANNLGMIARVTPAYVQINHEKFQRVMDNLIGNALKFSKENSKVEVIISKQGSNIIIEVKDQGIGIPKEKLPIVFDAFTKAGRTGLKGEQSTGLGLSIVKQIIEKHSGKIEVESEEGKGSTFRITLPEAGN